jgi:hypothetical protein
MVHGNIATFTPYSYWFVGLIEYHIRTGPRCMTQCRCLTQANNKRRLPTLDSWYGATKTTKFHIHFWQRMFRTSNGLESIFNDRTTISDQNASEEFHSFRRKVLVSPQISDEKKKKREIHFRDPKVAKHSWCVDLKPYEVGHVYTPSAAPYIVVM